MNGAEIYSHIGSLPKCTIKNPVCVGRADQQVVDLLILFILCYGKPSHWYMKQYYCTLYLVINVSLR